MNHSLAALARSLILPLALLLGAFLLIEPTQTAPQRMQFLVAYLPMLALAIPLLIAVLLNQSRMVGITLLILIAYATLSLTEPDWALSSDAITTLVCAYSLLVPLNLVLVSMSRERGLFNAHGVLLLLLIGGQCGLVGWLVHSPPLDVITPVTRPFLPLDIGGPIPDAGYVALLIAFAFLGWRSWRQPSTLNATLWLLPPVLGVSVYWQSVASLPELLIAASGLSLALGLVLDMQRIAYRDDLTGLPGRRALNFYLAAPGRHFTIAMLDVDHFKKFNDQYGHDVGDEVLRMVASQLQRVTGGGKAFRYGGEEFTIVFSGHDIAHARPHLEAVRQRIEDYELVVRSKNRPKDSKTGKQQRGSKKADARTTNVTISIGLASRSAECRSPDEVIKAADTALYKAKKGGRNRIAV